MMVFPQSEIIVLLFLVKSLGNVFFLLFFFSFEEIINWSNIN